MENKVRLLNDMINYAPNPIAVYRSEQLIIETANPAMIKAWGKGDQVIGRKLLELMPEIKTQHIHNQILQTFRTGKAYHAQDKKVYLKINGKVQTFFFNYSFIPLFDQNGEVYGVMDTGLDVTDLHEAHLQRRLSDERLRIAIDASGMGTYEIDLASRTITTSGNFNTLWSVENQEISNELLLAKMHPDDIAVRARAHRAARKTGVMSYEARILHPQGERWIKVDAKIIRNSHDIPSTIIGITQDIHKQKHFAGELQKQVAKSTEELQRSNEDLLHFAHLVSHDLKEPLRKIKFFNTLLCGQSDNALSEQQLLYCQKIERSAIRMQILIDGILAYSSLNNTRQSIEIINLNHTVNDILTDLELIIQEKNALIETAVLPSIEGAPVLIHQLLYNLIQNAIKFSKKNCRPEISIFAAILDNSEKIEIKVKDNGIGLNPSYAGTIFNPFERLHSKDAYEGNGLGLSLCKKIAIRHNGSIDVWGKPDAGAEFTVTLPVKQKEKII